MKRTLVAACFLSLASCMPKNGRLEVNRFQHETYPYAVFFTPEGDPLSPLGGPWRTDNFVTSAQGGYQAKRGPEYEVVRSYDANGDGSTDTEERGFIYDLLIKHAEKEATMWVSTTPVSSKDREKPLDTFAQHYVELAAAAGTIPVRDALDRDSSPRAPSRVLHVQPCRVSKRDAVQIDFEVADTSQPAAGVLWKRGRVVIVRTGYEHRLKHQGTSGQVTNQYPVIMTIGIGTQAQEFATFEPAFDTLLQRTVLGELGRGLSMNGESSCGSLAAANNASGSEVAAPGAAAVEENEAAKIPLAPEAMPQQGEPDQASP